MREEEGEGIDKIGVRRGRRLKRVTQRMELKERGEREGRAREVRKGEASNQFRRQRGLPRSSFTPTNDPAKGIEDERKGTFSRA